MDLYEELHELCEITSKELGEAMDKVRRSGGKVSPGDIDYLDKIAHTIKSVKTTMAMLDAEDEYGVSYDDGMGGRMSYARGRKRDSMGRYASRDRSYTGRSYDDGIMHKLNELMREAPDDRTRQKFSKFISEMEQM